MAVPYVPYLPKRWNRTLVVAEAQNLSATNAAYRTKLLMNDVRGQIRRLGSSAGDVGVGPWDDGSLKLAVEAAFGHDPEACGVSNAVLWSQVDGKDSNKTQEDGLVEESIRVWSEMLPELELRPPCNRG
ncbi:MAG: hypothetical protein QM765_51365 [Myxococcales bacterium]